VNVDASSSGIWVLLTGNPRFALLWLGQTLSRLGNYVYAAGIGVLAYQVSGSGAGVALTVGAFSVVQLVFVLLGGVVADRASRRLVLGSTDFLAFLLLAGLGAWTIAGRPPLWTLVSASGLLGILAGVHLPAYRAVVPEVVHEREIPAASALSALVNPTTIVVGPALGSALMLYGGASACLLADAGSFASAVLLLLPSLPGQPIVRTERAPLRPGNMLADVRAGLATIRNSPTLRSTIGSGAVAVACVDAPLTVLLPVLVGQRQWGTWMVGATVAAIGLGTAVSAPFLVRVPAGNITRAHGWAMAAAGLPLLIGVVSMSLVGWLAAAVGYGVLSAARYIRQVLMQQTAPRESLGRIFSVDHFAMLVLTPLSYTATGAAAGWMSPTALIVGYALLNLMLVAVVLRRTVNPS
jgi:MFS family permease